jgi:hypothetical protein
LPAGEGSCWRTVSTARGAAVELWPPGMGAAGGRACTGEECRRGEEERGATRGLRATSHVGDERQGIAVLREGAPPG